MLLCFRPCNLERTHHSIIQEIYLFYLLKLTKKHPTYIGRNYAIEIQGCFIPVSQRWGLLKGKLLKQNLTAWKNRSMFVYLTTCSLHQIKQSSPSNVITQDYNEHCWFLSDFAFVSKPLIVQHRRSLDRIVWIKRVLNTASVEGN